MYLDPVGNGLKKKGTSLTMNPKSLLGEFTRMWVWLSSKKIELSGFHPGVAFFPRGFVSLETFFVGRVGVGQCYCHPVGGG